MDDIMVMPIRFVTVGRYSELTGKTPGAIRKKIERGIWVEGKQYRRDMEGCIWVDIRGVEKWVEGTGLPRAAMPSGCSS